MRAAVIIVLVILVAAGGLLAWQRQRVEESTETLYLAVPMGLFVPVSKVMDRFQESYPDVEFMTMVDTPEAMVYAVEDNERKPDIFMSPGGHEAQVLVEKGLVDPASLVAFGSYELAILVPKGNPGEVRRLDDLLNPGVKVISFSEPEINAACHAARQSFQNLGIWDAVEEKIEVTGCCMESFKWIVDGRAEANVQFLGCPLDPKTAEMAESTKVEIACTFPRETFYKPRNVVGIVKTTEKRKLAEEFVEFMTSPEMIEFMAENRMRNDQNLPLTPGPWGPGEEASPMGAEVASR